MRPASHITNAPSAANARSIGSSDWLCAGVRQGGVHLGCESPASSIEVGNSAVSAMPGRFHAFAQKRELGDRTSKLKPV